MRIRTASNRRWRRRRRRGPVGGALRRAGGRGPNADVSLWRRVPEWGSSFWLILRPPATQFALGEEWELVDSVREL